MPSATATATAPSAAPAPDPEAVGAEGLGARTSARGVRSPVTATPGRESTCGGKSTTTPVPPREEGRKLTLSP
ncbi:hypothetical protein ACRAR1_26405 [Streptomyces sanyensis]|uniref:hypothetical protein n=1 Tax=Streptomyces sanyensis TaxID=568869 RepID=UPI003D770119